MKGLLSLRTDVTEARRRERALYESEVRLRAVVGAVADAIITVSGDGTIRSFNPAAERLFGFAAAEAIGRNVTCLMPAPFREEHDRYLRRQRQARKPNTATAHELIGRRRDGSTFPFELSISKVSRLDLFVELIRDVSERKRAEQRDRERRAEMARMLRVATAAELAGGLAHELNQPLTAIVNNVQACLSRIRAGEAAGEHLLRPLQLAADEALRAGAIVHSLRDLVERRSPRFERIDLRAPLRATCVLLRAELDQRGIDLRIEGIEKPVPINADAIQIEQVLINLVHNAIDSIAEAAGRTSQVVIAVARAGRGMLEVAVRDTGRGIATDVAERIFQPFFSTKPTGLGVGLALSRTIIEVHGGRLWAESGGSGKGATFRFTLPAYSPGGRRTTGAVAATARNE